MLCVNSNTHHQQKQQINVSKKKAQNHTKNTFSVCVKTSLSTSLHPPSPTPNPGQLDSFRILQFVLLRRLGDVILPMDVTSLNTTQLLPIPPAPSTSEKRGKPELWKMSQPKRQPWKPWNPAQNKKKKKLSPKIPSYLSISLFLLHTPNRVSLIFFGKENTAPNIEPPPPSNPPSMSPCRSSRSHSAPSSHRKATLEPSFWNLAAYSWKRSDKFSLVPKSVGKLRTKIKRGRDGGKFKLFFSK